MKFHASKSLYLVCALSLLAAACTVSPDYHAPDMHTALPAHYHTDVADTAPDAGRWWLNLQDPALTQLIEAALRHNPDIVAAEASIRQARANLAVVHGSQQVQLNADGRAGKDQFSQHSENFANIPFPNPKTEFSDYRAGFDASWEIDFVGRKQRSLEAAQARVDSVQYTQDDIRLRVAAEVARNVLDFRYWELRLNNAAAILENRRENLHLLELQKKAGVASENELLQARVAVSTSASQLPQMLSAGQAALLALTSLCDQSQDQIAQILQTRHGLPRLPEVIPAGLPADLLQRRADIRMAERQLAAASADIGVAIADQYPHISLIGNGGWDSISTSNLTQQASRYWSLGPQISIPLLSGGRLQSQVQAAEAARDVALSNYRKAVLTALTDTETALLRWQQEKLRYAQFESALHAQAAQVEFAAQSWQVGETSKINLLDAEQQLANLREQTLASQQALAVDLLSVYKALGGAWQDATPTVSQQ